MTENHDEGHAEHGHGVLQRADDTLGDDLSGVANHEEVADSLVEDDFCGEAGIAASEKGCQGGLIVGECSSSFHILSWMVRFAGDESTIAADHLRP